MTLCNFIVLVCIFILLEKVSENLFLDMNKVYFNKL